MTNEASQNERAIEQLTEAEADRRATAEVFLARGARMDGVIAQSYLDQATRIASQIALLKKEG